MLQRAQIIKYKGYNYSINKNEDYFQRKNELIMTILNSEDTAIKICENNPNKNRDSLYGDCPVPVGSPRDTNVEWYPLTEISDCAQFFSDGIESNDVIQGCLGDCWFISALSVLATKDYLLRGEFNEEMLGDKN